jgi:hypothetical protein
MDKKTNNFMETSAAGSSNVDMEEEKHEEGLP